MTIGLVTTTGTVSSRLHQNRRRNMSAWPECSAARVAVAAVLRRGFDLMRRVVRLALHVGHPCGLRVVEEQRTFAAQRTDL